MGSVIPFPLRAHHETSSHVDAATVFRQGAPDRLRNSAEPPPGDIFDDMIARIRVARCYMLCHTQLSAALWRQHANVSSIKQNVAFEPKRRLYLISRKRPDQSLSTK